MAITKKLILTKEQENEICEIIISSKQVNKDVTTYLKDRNLKHSERNNSGFIKDLIWGLIFKYKLQEQHCIPRYLSNIPLNQQEFDVIVGGLLGDTWIGRLGKEEHISGSFTHKLEHYDYCKYKYELLKRRCSNFAIHNKFDKRSDRYYQQVFCKIAASDVLTPIHDAFYVNGRKTIPKDLIYKLSPLGLAIWYMDDGSSSTYGYQISVDCFTEEEVQILQDMLKDNYDINTTYHANKSNSTIRFNIENARKWKKLINPYMCDCMKYKLLIWKNDKNNKHYKGELE